MNKTLTAAVAALTVAGVAAGAAVPAQAQSYRHHDGRYDNRHRDNDDNAGVAIAAGVIGLALGAALASSSRDDNPRYQDNRYQDNRYRYGNSYRYAPHGASYAYTQPRYRVCTSRERAYDPYTGRRITVRRQYAC